MYHEINNNIEINFPLPPELFYLIEEIEEADKLDDGRYYNLADTIDICCKNLYAAGKITKTQWNTIERRYPQ